MMKASVELEYLSRCNMTLAAQFCILGILRRDFFLNNYDK